MAESDNYPLGRDIFHSGRSVQHLLWRLHTGYILHPRIPVTDDMRIAELGTGMRIWLFEATKYLPPSTQLDGFDISDEQFPLKEQCLPNLRFDIMDSFVDPPAALVGRNFRDRDSGTILRHVMQLLKPGRFVQWEEVDITHQVVLGEKAKQFEAGMNKVFGQVISSWVPNFPKRVKQIGFRLIEFQRQQFQNNLMNICTNTHLLALHEILQGLR
ncbi:hypothetical protein BDV36DRAFT_287667 [Aspergillus pseudocaelatus]|uniref:Methyltransferase domain-containing protein n=1 Tax=Aspergillus pseudocaelatus TaxID=1825620 RepID=A0ABQ6W6M9_9EURO|nr:hypothetical protein BDV36DRAFT_287667 [Aspergillus pseudocaelatus]